MVLDPMACPPIFSHPMSALNSKKRMVSIALYVSAFVVFAFLGDARNAVSSCGDYLIHTRLSNSVRFAGIENDSQPLPVCHGCNCRSLPSLPPVEPSRIVPPRRQPSDFQPTLTSLNLSKVQVFESVDEALPSSLTLEVLTPPPILTI